MSGERTILITGANRGIGLGLAEQFLRRGWKVFAACRRPDAAAVLTDLKRGHAGNLEILRLDVCDERSVSVMAANLAQLSPSLDVLINNAGINPEPRDQTVADISVATVAQVFDINVLGALRVMQAVLPLLKGSACPRVVNISSGAGSLAHNPARRPQPAYCISKAALNMLTRRAAQDLALGGVITVSISPGWIKTDMGGANADLSVEEATAALATTIENLQAQHNGLWLDRFGQPSEYAW